MLSVRVQLGAVPQSLPGLNGEIGVADQLGRFAWYELLTTDVAAAGAFYRKVVGWGVTDESTSGLHYTVLRSGGTPLGGLMDIPEEGRRCRGNAEMDGLRRCRRPGRGCRADQASRRHDLCAADRPILAE